jgi:twitching motility protein PilT
MQTFDQSLLGLLRKNLVSYDEALRWATHVDEFKLKVQGIATASDEAQEQMARGIIGSKEPAAEITRFTKR